MSQGYSKGIPIDTDTQLTLDSDFLVPSQKAVKSYVESYQGSANNAASLGGIAAVNYALKIDVIPVAVTANLAFDHANGAYSQANTANITADLAYGVANQAFAIANTANITADLAFGHANAAYAQANTANITADIAYGHANLAFAKANTACTDTAAAFSKANTANITADLAFDKANAANVLAFNALPQTGGTISGDLIVQGNAVFSGETTYANTQTLLIGDNIFVLNADLPVDTPPSEDAGITVNRGNAANADLFWNEATDKWTIQDGSGVYRNIASNTDVETVSTATTAAFGKANSAQLDAAAAFAKANTANITADIAFDHANLAFGKANSTLNVISDSVNTTRYLMFANGVSGTIPALNVATGLTFNPSTNSLVTGSIVLSGTGNPLIGTIQSNNNFSAGLVVRKKGNPSDIDGSVLSGAELGYNSFFGWNGDGFVRGAYIIVRTSEDWNNTNRGSRLSFATTAIGSNVNVENVTIDPSGNLLIGRTGSIVGQNVKLDVNGAINASAVLVNGVPLQTTSLTSNVVISVADNTNAALRITQTGTSEAIRVEDDTNPDVSPFIVDSTGNVIIGSTVTESSIAGNHGGRLQVIGAGGSDGGICVYANTDIVTTSSSIRQHRRRSAGAVNTGDRIGIQQFAANTGVEYRNAVLLIAEVDSGTVSSTSLPGRFIVSTTPNGSFSPAERLRIDSSGNVLIGRTDSTVGLDVKLDVAGSINADSIILTNNVSTQGLNVTSNVINFGTAMSILPNGMIMIYGDINMLV